ncbi:caveolin-1-like isoform X2 [Lytechinus variegatus]|nr:caveolin-1-like isoform X2 [Lytechinus variegatus]
MDQPINPYIGHQGTNPPVPQYGSTDDKERVNNSDLTPRSASTVHIITSDDNKENEDIYKFTPHVPVAYDETFKESESVKGFPFMKEVNGSIFKYTHFALYATLTLILGPIFSFVWAIAFALFHIVIIWLIQPVIKFVYLGLRISSLLFAPSIRLFLDPIWISTSLVFSNIRAWCRLKNSDITLNVKNSQV